jgi:hypothetical protein
MLSNNIGPKDEMLFVLLVGFWGEPLHFFLPLQVAGVSHRKAPKSFLQTRLDKEGTTHGFQLTNQSFYPSVSCMICCNYRGQLDSQRTAP